MAELLGSIEAGGTKFVCAVGTGPGNIQDRVRIETAHPSDTLGAVVEFFARHQIASLGIASFGPLELRRDHADYGKLTTTPKPGWAGVDLVGTMRSSLAVPIALETDVVGAALGEWRWGAGRGLRNLVYVTVGTGIGAGLVVDGRPVPGMVHSEMGHIPIIRHPDDTFAGFCPFHGDCLEGMASGPALEARWGRSGGDLGELTARAVEMEAHYLAVAFRTLVYTLAPQRIILGGGVGSLPGLFDRIGADLVTQLNGYATQPEHADGFVVPPGLGSDAGIAGGFELARRALG